MPKPLTSTAGAAFGVAGSGAGSAAAAGSAAGAASAGAGAAGAATGAFLAPGRRAPAAMPRPLTGSAALAGSSAAGAAAGAADSTAGAAAAGAFFAPGRFAPLAMPRPLTGSAALAGSSAAGASIGRGCWPLSMPSPGCRRRFLGAGTLGSARDAQTLDRRGLLRRRGGCLGSGGGGRGFDRGRLGFGLGRRRRLDRCRGGGRLGSGALLRQRDRAQVQRPQQQLGDVEHLDLVGLLPVADTVGDHHAAERAAGRDLGCVGGQCLVDALVVDALADVLFHPHPRAARAAAETAFGVARHLGERSA